MTGSNLLRTPAACFDIWAIQAFVAVVAAGRRAAAQALSPNVAAREAKMEMQGFIIKMDGFC